MRAAVTAGAVVLAAGLLAAGAVRVPDGGPGPPRASVAGVAVTADPGPHGDVGAAPEGPAAAGAGPGETTATLRPPLDDPIVVSRPFDAPAQPWQPGHRGVDLAAHSRQAVRAPASGVVTFAGTVVDRGVVTITHPDGLRSSLEPVLPTVTVGQRVLPGQVVASVAPVAGHCAPATCLHWGLRRGETYLDPMRWVLDRGPIVLLPGG